MESILPANRLGLTYSLLTADPRSLPTSSDSAGDQYPPLAGMLINFVLACSLPLTFNVPLPGKGEAPFMGAAPSAFGASGTTSTTISECPERSSVCEIIWPDRCPNELI